MAKIIIFGTGDIAQIAHYYFNIDSPHQVVAFTADGQYIKEDTFEGKPVVPFEQLEQLYPPDEHAMFVALSYAQMNKLRQQKYEACKAKGYTLVNYVSSHCTMLTQYPIGDNCFIFEDNTIQPFVRIGSNVTLWSGNHIGHHSTIEDHNFVSSHVVISGHCHIGRNCFLGVNATLHNGVRLAPETLVGAGGIIAKDTEEKGVYLPERAKLFHKTSDQIKL